MNRGVTNQKLKRFEKARKAEKKARAQLEAAQRDFDEEVAAAGHREDKVALAEKQHSRKARDRELFRVGGIAAKAGLTGLSDDVLESLFLDARERLDCGEQPWQAAAALVEQAGLGKEDPEVILGILLRGREALNDVALREKLAAKGRAKLREVEEQRNRHTYQEPTLAGRVDRPPMKVRFTEPPSSELRAELKQLGMKFFREEGAWRGPSDLATKVRSAIRVTGESGLVAYPSDWRDG